VVISGAGPRPETPSRYCSNYAVAY